MAINPRSILNTAFVTGGTKIFADFRANEATRTPKRYNKLTTTQNGSIPWNSTPCFSLIAHALIFTENNSATADLSKTRPVLDSTIYFFRKADMAFMGFSSYSRHAGSDSGNGLWELANIDDTQLSVSGWAAVANPQGMPTTVTPTPTTQSINLQISTGPVGNPTPSSRGSVLQTVPAEISYQEVVTGGRQFVQISLIVAGTNGADSFFLESNSNLVKYIGTSGSITKIYNRY
jgi:hypothetical protein